MERKQAFTVFLLLIVSSLFVFAFSQAGVFAYQQTFASGSRFSTDTFIGPVDVSELTEAEATDKVSAAFSSWKTTSPLILTLSGSEAAVSEAITLDLTATISEATSGKRNPLQISIDEHTLYIALEKIYPDNYARNSLHKAELLQDITAAVQLLPSDGAELQAARYVNIEQTEETVASARLQALDDEIVFLAPYVQNDKRFVVEPESRFSILEAFQDNGTPGEKGPYLTMLASALYKAAAETNFTIAERHYTAERPDYIPLGFHATAIPDEIDFVIGNPNPYPYTIVFSTGNGELKVEIKGMPFIHTYEAQLSAAESYQEKTIVHYSPYLTGKQVNIVEEGKPGESIQLFRYEKAASGELVAELLLGSDYYPPVHHIEERPLPAGGDGSSDNNTGTTIDGSNSGTAGAPSGDSQNGSGEDNDGQQNGGLTPDDGSDDDDDGTVWDVPGEIEKGS